LPAVGPKSSGKAPARRPPTIRPTPRQTKCRRAHRKVACGGAAAARGDRDRRGWVLGAGPRPALIAAGGWGSPIAGAAQVEGRKAALRTQTGGRVRNRTQLAALVEPPAGAWPSPRAVGQVEQAGRGNLDAGPGDHLRPPGACVHDEEGRRVQARRVVWRFFASHQPMPLASSRRATKHGPWTPNMPPRLAL
jgi:hypothetical protein